MGDGSFRTTSPDFSREIFCFTTRSSVQLGHIPLGLPSSTTSARGILHLTFATTSGPTNLMEITSTGSGLAGGSGGSFLPQPIKAMKIESVMKRALLLMGERLQDGLCIRKGITHIDSCRASITCPSVHRGCRVKDSEHILSEQIGKRFELIEAEVGETPALIYQHGYGLPCTGGCFPEGIALAYEVGGKIGCGEEPFS